jgi:trk/ktr system potassium uptake protein
MNIIILGAGQVGSALAEHLVHEDNDITIIDTDIASLDNLQQRLDIRCITGHAAHPDSLQQAGADNADMLIAVTSSDETNMIGCQVAYSLFHVPTRIARIRHRAYLQQPELLQKKAIPVDFVISPEQLVTRYVERLIEFPGALQVLDFADGKVQLVAVKPYYGGPMVGKTIGELHDSLGKVDIRIAAIFRRNHAIALSGATVIEAGDEVFIIATPRDIRNVLDALGRLDNLNQKIMIAGGGNIGTRLAQTLETSYQVKLIERDPAKSKQLSESLNNTTVLLGNASDRELLLNENIEYIDVFCAVTNDDEANIMACLQAKRLGAKQVMALITHTPYIDLVEGQMIDIVISPQQATIGSILTHLRQGDIVNVHALRRGAAEAIEVIAHGDENTSKVVGRKVGDIKLPTGTVMGAIVRNDKAMIAHKDVVIQSDDHLILFVTNKKTLRAVERLFQVSVGFWS